jgi:hypothetical protein
MATQCLAANNEKVREEKRVAEPKDEVAVEVEPKSGISYQVKLDDGKQLGCAGLRRKHALGMNLKIYGFGIYFFYQNLTYFTCGLCFSLVEFGLLPIKNLLEIFRIKISGGDCL